VELFEAHSGEIIAERRGECQRGVAAYFRLIASVCKSRICV
jgi:hypothetical protein